jgi:hypothetical protein
VLHVVHRPRLPAPHRLTTTTDKETDMTTSRETSARARLEAKIKSQTTAMLCQSVVLMYAEDHAGMDADEAAARGLVRRSIADELCRRHPEADALLEDWMGDETEAGLEFVCNHTYGELVALAVTETAAA